MSYHQLTHGQRYQIARLNSLGKSKAMIAELVGVDRSTIFREVKRNSFEIIDLGARGRKMDYDAVSADGLARDRRKEACEVRFKVRGRVRAYVIEKLKLRWSPEQIAGRAKLDGIYDLSCSSIYRFIELDRQDMRGENLYSLLRRFSRRRRRLRKKKVCRTRKGAPKKSIRERPKEADLRQELGHFERDLMEGPRKAGRAVLVVADRKSRYLFLRFVQKDGKVVQRSTARLLKSPKAKKCKKSITQDNGSEFIPAISKQSEEELGVPVYFCDPCSPWQRGTVENSIGLLRQYLPKKHDFSKMNRQKLSRIEAQLNSRPRKILNYRTPSEIFFASTCKGSV